MTTRSGLRIHVAHLSFWAADQVIKLYSLLRHWGWWFLR
jgi:hypothetical protein